MDDNDKKDKDNSNTYRALDYPSFLKYLLSAYCSLIIIIGPFYLLGVIENSFLKISVTFSTTFALFLIISSITGFISVLINKPSFKIIYGHSLLFQMILSIVLIGTSFYFVDSTELQKDFSNKFTRALMTGDSKDVDPIQNYLQCCGTNYQNKKKIISSNYSSKSNLDKIDRNSTYRSNSTNLSPNSKIDYYLSTGLFNRLLFIIPEELHLNLNNQNETNSKNYRPSDDKLPFDLPKSCCKKSNLDKNNKCKLKLSHEKSCSYIFDVMFDGYRILSISLLLLSFVFQSILYSLFRINIGHLIRRNN